VRISNAGPRLVTRRELLKRAGAGLLGVALTSTLSACATDPAPSTGVPVASSADGPRRGGILRFGQVGDLTTLEGQTTNLQGYDHLYGVWDRLLTIDANQQPQPMLAEHWEIADDYRQIKFNLRRGVQFHTGRELTAEDVKWSLERIQDPKIGSTLTGRAAPMTGVETPDKYTVIVKASRPWVEAFDLLEQTNILDSVTFQSAGLSRPTGTGPFVFAEFAQGDHLRLVRNRNYWRSGLPYLDEILVTIHADPQAAVVSLEAGAIDLISYGLPVKDTIRLQQDPNNQVLINDLTGTSWVAILNCTRTPTDSKLVRQAMNYALDRQRMATTLWHGREKPIALPWNSTSPAYDAVKNRTFGFDLDKARSLLGQAGMTDMHLELVSSTALSDSGTLAQIYQADLVKIGLEVTLRPLEPAVYFATRNNRSYQGVFFILASGGYLKPASNTLGAFYGPQDNFAGFKDDAYTRLVNEVTNETGPAAQHQLYNQLNDYYLDQSWVLPIVPNPERVAARGNVRGLRYDTHQALVPAEMWLA
jgi:peptide/nickel transport system substrate-binding protein